MKPVIFICLIVLVGLSVWWLFPSKIEITNYPPQSSTVVAFGDSLVSGVGATEGNDFVSQLSGKIGRPIMNMGVPGNTTADGVLRISDVIKKKPGIVLLLLGGNDTLRQIPITTTEANLRTLIEAFQKSGAVVVFIGVRGGVLGSDREDMYERVSEEYGALYVPDILDGIFLKRELMSDGIHPNDAGHARIAERLSDIFKDHEL